MESGAFREFFNRFVPTPILESGDLELRLRARVLGGLYVTSFVISLFLLLICIVADVFFNIDILMGYTVVGFVFFISALQIWLFYRNANIVTCSIIYSMMFFACTLGGVILTGGWSSPILLLFFCCPAISFLVGGKSEGIYMSCLITASAICLLITNQLGMEFFQFLAPENFELARFSVWTVSIITLTSCFAVYDSLLQGLTKNIDSIKQP